MSLPPSLLKPQTSTLFSLLPTSPFGLTTSHRLFPSQTRLKFSHKTSALTSSSHSSPFQLSPQSYQKQESIDAGDDEEDEEHVVGDCLVFEEGIFEDPYLRESSDSVPNLPKPNNKTPVEVKPEDLIPEKWKEVRAEINITKKERRKMAQELEFGRSVNKRKQALLPIRDVSVEDYKAYREKKLSQLKPVVLKSPRYLIAAEKIDDEDGSESEEDDDVSVPTRVPPRNPRLAVYGVSMDDISEFFNSENYDPKAAKSPEGRRKLFTREEKILLNMRKPDLSFAASGRWLPLHTLVASGEFYLVNTLLKHNVDINIENKDGLTALHKTVLSKKQAIFNYLLRESANPFVRDKEGATLMHYAVRAASTPMIKILLLYNVDINLQDHSGWTPLHLAVQTRRTDIVRLLLIKGADKTLKTKNGLSPLDLCLCCGWDTRTCEVIKQLKQEPRARKDP